jgi:hypothetical protein
VSPYATTWILPISRACSPIPNGPYAGFLVGCYSRPVEGGHRSVGLDPLAAQQALGQVGLRVGVDEQDPLPGLRQGPGDVKAGGSLRDPPLRFKTTIVDMSSLPSRSPGDRPRISPVPRGPGRDGVRPPKGRSFWTRLVGRAAYLFGEEDTHSARIECVLFALLLCIFLRG